MTTSVQLDRIKTRFDSWDVNGDGRIDRADFDAESKRILRAFGEAPGSPRSRVLSDAYLGMWNFFAGKAGIDKENGRLTPSSSTTSSRNTSWRTAARTSGRPSSRPSRP